MLYLLIICLVNQIKLGNSACTVNEKYGRAVTSVNEIVLCLNNDCKSSKKTLKNNEVYQWCTYTNELARGSMQIYISQKTMVGLEDKKCVDETGNWIDRITELNCVFKKPLKFTSYANILETQVYVVACDDNRQEFPNEDVPRLQITGFDSYESTINKNLVVFPTQLVKCVSNCLEFEPKWTASSGESNIEIKGSQFTVKTGSTNLYTQVKVKCSIDNLTPKEIEFYLPDAYNVTLYTNADDRNRTPSYAYDAGEVLGCNVIGYNTRKDNFSGPIPPVNVDIVELNSAGQVSKKFTNNSKTTVMIPNRLIDINCGVLCYLGISDFNNTDEYFQIRVLKIKVQTKYVTKLLIGGQRLDIYDFKPFDEVQCDLAYYNNASGSNIFIRDLYILYTTKSAYPLSRISAYENPNWDNATSGIMTFGKKHDKQMYAMCVIERSLTTPIAVYSGDRPELDIHPMHPAWKTEYQLKGFSFVCIGSHINAMDFQCTDCMPGISLDLTRLNSTCIKAVIPRVMIRNVQITYKCVGYSDKYDSVYKELRLKIIVSEITDVYGEHEFFLYAEDYIICRATFTVKKNDISTRQHTVVPVQLQIDASSTKNINGKLDKILIIRDNDTTIDVSTIVRFQGCCPLYKDDGIYACEGKWKEVKVGRSYNEKFNIETTEVYPGNTLRCYICVFYTHERIAQPCKEDTAIPAKIKIKITDPNGNVTESDLVNEVRAPIEGLKPDGRGHYKISDYEVSIGCRVRGVINMITIKMKSCNINPPTIFIVPPDKSMFIVGDIFSCSTEAINCKSGLIYTIYVQRGSENADKKSSHSFTLTKKHTGNNIKITCVAGEAESSKDVRTIRVEIGPYNVSIHNSRPLMKYGEYLKCLSLGFPPPSITWTQIKGPSPLRISEGFLLIGPWDFSGEYVIQCEAKNKRGSISKSTSFKVFNPRIVYTDYSFTFYVFVPILTLIYLVMLVLSLLIIFQENVFGIPFFSQGGAESQTGSKPKRSPIVEKPISKQESVLTTLQQDDEKTEV